MDYEGVTKELSLIARELTAANKPKVRSPWHMKEWEEGRSGPSFMLQNDGVARIELDSRIKEYKGTGVVYTVYMSEYYHQEGWSKGKWNALHTSANMPKFDSYDDAMKLVQKWMKEYKSEKPQKGKVAKDLTARSIKEKNPDIYEKVMRVHGGDPLYVAILEARTDSDMRQAMKTLNSIRGTGSVNKLKKLIKG